MNYPEIVYSDGQHMRVGDVVELKRRFRRKECGIVVFVYNPKDKIIPNGDNEYGFSIRLDSGAETWSGRQPGKELVLKHRSTKALD